MEEKLIEEFSFPKATNSINKYDPMSDTSCFGRFFFHWAYRIIALSKKTLLKAEYLGNLPPNSRSKSFIET